MFLPVIYVYYMEAVFANILLDRRSMQANLGLLNGVATSWTCNIQSTVKANSTDAKKKRFSTLAKERVHSKPLSPVLILIPL